MLWLVHPVLSKDFGGYIN